MYLFFNHIIRTANDDAVMPVPITIAQIAEAAGVSTATVDRVLNNRPGVNADTIERVNAAARDLGRGAPARGRPRVRNYRFALSCRRRGSLSSTWSTARSRWRARLPPRAHHRGHTPPRRIATRARSPPSSPTLNGCDGIALLGARCATGEAGDQRPRARAGVHVVTLFSDVAGAMRETFIGADNLAAGRMAGLLLGRSIGPVPRRTRRASRCFAGHPVAAEIERRIGFAQVIEERFANLDLLRMPDVPRVGGRRACATAPTGSLDSTTAPPGGHLQRRLRKLRRHARAGRGRPRRPRPSS